VEGTLWEVIKDGTYVAQVTSDTFVIGANGDVAFVDISEDIRGEERLTPVLAFAAGAWTEISRHA
jgi:hypothetical protein